MNDLRWDWTPGEPLEVADLAALSDEATRQNLSLACLLAAMEDDSPILWMRNEDSTNPLRQ